MTYVLFLRNKNTLIFHTVSTIFREIIFTKFFSWNWFHGKKTFIIFDNYYTTYTSISLLVCVFSLFGFDSMMIDSSNAWPEMKGEEDVFRFDVWAHQSRKLALRPRRILGQKLGLLFAMHMYKLYSYYVPT